MDHTRQHLTRLKWLTVFVPAVAVFAYETVRHDFLENVLPTAYGNVVVGLLALFLAYIFAELLFGAVERLQRRAVAREKEVATVRATVREQERLSRDLHDGLAQVVSYLMLRLDTVNSLVRADRQAAALGELDHLRQVTNDLYVDVRESIAGLRSGVSEKGLIQAFRAYADEFEERYGIRVELDSWESTGDMPASVSLELFRIVQEALANVRKHADAHHVKLSLLRSEAGELELAVIDDGKGFDPAKATVSTSSFGLAGMRERAELLGGRCDISSTPSTGTRVVVTVPVPESDKGRQHESLATAAG